MVIEQQKRDRVKQKRRPIILIQSEGKNKTEEIYFRNFKKSRNYNIVFGKGNDTDPENMVKSLKKNISDLGLNKKDNDMAFCIFDTDVDANKQMQINKATTLINKNGMIELIKSNPCFEIWYLFHFKCTSKIFNSNNEVIKELQKYIPNYEKNQDYFYFLNDKINNAIMNAKAIEENHIKNGKDINNIECNPSTDVYKVVEKLVDLNYSH